MTNCPNRKFTWIHATVKPIHPIQAALVAPVMSFIKEDSAQDREWPLVGLSLFSFSLEQLLSLYLLEDYRSVMLQDSPPFRLSGVSHG